MNEVEALTVELIEKFIPPPLDAKGRATDKDGWKWYEDRISVTTVLENSVANPSLSNWYKKNSEKKIEKVRSETANFGGNLHDIFEKILKGEEIDLKDVEEKAHPHVENFLKWKEDHKVQRIHTEVQLASMEYGFEGTADFVGLIDGELCIADWKLTRKYRITNGWQLGAYRIGARETLGVNPGLVGLQINRVTAEPQMFKYQHFDYVEHKFLCALEVFKGLYFNKLQKLNWKWLEKQAVKLCH